MKLAWITDPHLNFIGRGPATLWMDSLRAWDPDAFLIGGDIGEAGDVASWLELFAERLARPVYFVLGNHDYYGGHLAGVRAQVRELAASNPHLTWLSESEPVALSERTGLVGHGGWGDGRFGDPAGTRVVLNDFIRIADLNQAHDRPGLLENLRALGDEAAAHLRRVLPAALDRFERVLVLTHVPPLAEACWHENARSNDDWLPWFTCAAVGELLLELAAAHPTRSIQVYCGHTHGWGEAWPLPNLGIRTGAVEYGAPAAQPPIWVP